VTPSVGSGLNATLVAQYSDPNGGSDLASVGVWVGSAYKNSCYLYYQAGSNSIFLLNDSDSGWLGPLVLGTATAIQNSQCVINAASTSISISGDVFTLTLSLTFRASFAGSRIISLWASDRAGLATNWQARGTWNVVSGNSAPLAGSLTPSIGAGLNATLTAEYSDPDGAADLALTGVWIGSTLKSSCYIFYNRSSNTISMLNDADTGWLGPLTPGADALLVNSQCAINGRGTSVATSGNTATFSLSITFNAAFAGSRVISLFAVDRSGAATAWGTRGSWNVQP
jgi:hypothetical protein